MMTYARLSPGKPRLELACRELARRHLLDFTTYTYPLYQPEPVHDLIARTLERVFSREIRKLLIVAPPQHGKTELVSVRFPAWWLGQRPDDPIVLTSYSAGLAGQKAGECRDLMESALYAALFPVRVSRASRARNAWRIAGHRGGLRAAGVGGGITGHGAAAGIIDDPIQDWAQAQSEVIREKVWDWYRGTFRQRLWKDAPQIVMHTRWHEEDLAGRLLATQPGEWYVLHLPAVAVENDPLGRQPGEALAPNRYPIETLREIERDVGPVVWGAVYQGTPVPLEGGLFDVAKLRARMVPALPLGTKSVRYWDWAGEGRKADYTAGGRMDMMVPDGPWFISDMRRGHWSPHEVEAQVLAAARDDGPRTVIYLELEPGAAGETWAKNLSKKLRGYRVRLVRPTGKKWVRAMSFSAQVAAGNVYVVRGYWNDDLFTEMRAAALGRDAAATDDQWDSLAGAFMALTKFDSFQTADVDLYAPPKPPAEPLPMGMTEEEAERLLDRWEQEGPPDGE